MIELLFAIVGVMVAFFVIVGGMFWAWGFITSAFDGAFNHFRQQTESPFTFDASSQWVRYQEPIGPIERDWPDDR